MQTIHEQVEPETVLPLVNQAQSSEQAGTNEYTTLPKAKRKRIVSKRRYVANVGKKVALSSASLGFLLAASCFLIWTFAFVGISRMPAGHQSDFGTPEEAPPFILGFGGAALLSYILAWLTLNRVSRVDTGVPLTRANTAELPAPDSLVRASKEPMQAQGSALLRAATKGQQTPPEQLLRATTAQE